MVRKSNAPSVMPRTFVYVGHREDLKGRTALVRAGKLPGRVLAQFDPPKGMKIEQCSAQSDTRAFDPLCFGWHDFAADQFVPQEGK